MYFTQLAAEKNIRLSVIFLYKNSFLIYLAKIILVEFVCYANMR